MTGPYIVTTKRGEKVISRRAAPDRQLAALRVVCEIDSRGHDSDGWDDVWATASEGDVFDAPLSLPDGTVIEVDQVTLKELCDELEGERVGPLREIAAGVPTEDEWRSAADFMEVVAEILDRYDVPRPEHYPEEAE